MFFGFFITLGSAVNAVRVAMLLNGDPQFQAGSLVVFAVLGVLVYGGLLYLVRHELPSRQAGRRPSPV